MIKIEYGIVLYLAVINVVGFFLMGLDKWKAKYKKWRIPEKTLFGAAIFGGSLGAWAGMYAFHHKTRHWYFVVGMPLILAVQVAVLWFEFPHFL
ncbi:hypothetical protein C806_03543 [Lachnospiraceae bacterium 3-1]|nr:hypothetical protein C806_03543 [Lachnospiraceae bacterium 3-1]